MPRLKYPGLIILLIVPAISCAQIHISGELNGTLPDTVYIVDDYIRVYANDTLLIEPGAVFLFSGNYQLQIYGLLKAEGTSEDSILFKPQSPGIIWGGLYFDSSCSDSSKFTYCSISGSGLGGLNCYGCNISISHCTFENNTCSWGGGVYLSNSNPIISYCVIKNNTVNCCGGGLYATGSNPLISYCVIDSNHCDGYGSGMGGGGICFNHASNGTIIHSAIFGNTSGSSGGGMACSDNSNVQIQNCTIAGNSSLTAGGGVNIYYAAPDIVNSIVADNFGAGGVNFQESADASLTYSDFHANENGDFAGVVPEELGWLSGVNAGGDSCDIFSNIFIDPLFFTNSGELAYHLTGGSHCIDAGNPASPLDPDNSISDIGAYYFDRNDNSVIPLILVQNNDIILKWNKSFYADSYNIYKSPTPYVFPLIPAFSASDTTYIDIGAASREKGYYRITVVY